MFQTHDQWVARMKLQTLYLNSNYISWDKLGWSNLGLQPFAKRLAVPDLGDFENKQNKINPIVGFSFFPRLSTCTISCLVNETFLNPLMNLQCVNQPVKS